MRGVGDIKPVALYLARNAVMGGAERVFVNYANNAREVSPVVALLERRGELLSELDPRVRCVTRPDRTAPGSRAAALAARMPAEQFARLAPECLWLRRTVKETGAMVVTSFLMRAHLVALLTKLLLLPRMPVVINIHEHMTESARFLYPRGRDRALMQWITRHLFPRADRIVVVAAKLERDLIQSYGVPEGKIGVVHNPLDVARVRIAGGAALEPDWTRPASRQTIVAVGRLVELKGFDLLLHALARLRQTRDVGLIVIGEGPARVELEALASRLALTEVVTFAGMQPNPWRFVAHADVFALTSRTEAFPSVLSEAMALGVPILATDCSAGVRECLGDGECGLMVPSGDIEGIAGGLDRLLGDAELCASLVAAGQTRVTAFDPTTLQRRYESVLAWAMASRSA